MSEPFYYVPRSLIAPPKPARQLQRPVSRAYMPEEELFCIFFCSQGSYLPYAQPRVTTLKEANMWTLFRLLRDEHPNQALTVIRFSTDGSHEILNPPDTRKN